MICPEPIPIEPIPELRFKRGLHLKESVCDLWRSRELMWTLAERELRARYKEAWLGATWALLTPLALMVVFSLFLQRVAHFDTGGAPYALFSYLGLLPWAFFSTSVSVGGQSLVLNRSLLNKIHCPREVFPLASVLVAGTDMVVSSAVLLLLFVITQFPPNVTSLWVPIPFIVQCAFTVGITLILSSGLVYLRDLRHGLPIALQLGLFGTPVAYGIEVIPERLQLFYSILNPLAPAIDSYRRIVLYGRPPDWHLLIPGAISAFGVLLVGYMAFKRLETHFADVA